MTPTITLQQREKQLQSLLGTPEGREELQDVPSPTPGGRAIGTHPVDRTSSELVLVGHLRGRGP